MQWLTEKKKDFPKITSVGQSPVTCVIENINSGCMVTKQKHMM